MDSGQPFTATRLSSKRNELADCPVTRIHAMDRAKFAAEDETLIICKEIGMSNRALHQLQTWNSKASRLSTSHPLSVMTIVRPSDMARLCSESARMACMNNTMPGHMGSGLPT